MSERQLLNLGRQIVRYTLANRKHHDRERFPLTGGWIQQVSRQLGCPIGRNRAYQVQHALIASGAIIQRGQYPQRRKGHFTGYNVKLYACETPHTRSSVPSRDLVKLDLRDASPKIGPLGWLKPSPVPLT